MISLDYEHVFKRFGFLSLGLSASAQASVEYSPLDSKTTRKAGIAGEGEAEYRRTEKSPFFVKLNVSVEKTYDKEGNSSFRWSPAVWKVFPAVGLRF